MWSTIHTNLPGVLIECDPSIKSIIVKIDSEDHAFIVEELDDQHLVVKENMVAILKMKLDEVNNGPKSQVGRKAKFMLDIEGDATSARRFWGRLSTKVLIYNNTVRSFAFGISALG